MIFNLTTLYRIVRAGLGVLWLLSLPFFVSAQSKPGLRLVPLGHATPQESTLAARQQALGDTLTLPFWDDFSALFSQTTAGTLYQPDTTRWAVGSQHVRINTGMALNPPTLGVATFDGVDATGRAYSDNDLNAGLSDTLVSKPINLALVAPNERNSVFMSFFWQKKGNGELPDVGDSLRLQFKNNQNQWITQWLEEGGDSVSIETFTQEIIAITDPAFYHSGFQFRFQSYNRQSGSFDTWNIDYIYLNKNRSASNNAYLDRALTTSPSSIFKDYTAIPIEIFKTNPALYIGNASVQFYNLNAQLQPVRFTAQIKNQLTGQVVAVLNDQNALSPVPAGFERRTISAAPVNSASLDLTADSLYLQTEFYITSGDKYLIASINGADTVFNTEVDYRINDTVRTTFVLDEHFAYDDGDAEFGVELNQKNGKLAYQFYSPIRTLLTHIDMYFPAINQNQSRSPIKLHVWKSLGNDTLQDLTIITTDVTAQPASAFNEFVSFELSTPVFVEDTFYIGYEQQGDNIAVVGFDKNTNTTDKLFYNVGGGWQQNADLAGSLMLRPRFDDEQIPVGLPEKPQEKPYKIYPNPVEDQLTIEGPHEEVSLLNIIGQSVFHQSYGATQQVSTFDFSALKTGVYFLKIRHKHQYHTTKLLVR